MRRTWELTVGQLIVRDAEPILELLANIFSELKAVMINLEGDEPKDEMPFVIGICSGDLAITDSFATRMGMAA